MRTALLMSLLALSGCAEHAMVGEIFIDLSGEVPVFDFTEGGAPTTLWVMPDATCSGASSSVWEVYRIEPEDWPLTYGEAPEGSRVIDGPERLER